MLSLKSKISLPQPNFHRPERKSMLLDPKPVYRRVILPWYDSEIVCFATLLFAGFVLFFGFLRDSCCV